MVQLVVSPLGVAERLFRRMPVGLDLRDEASLEGLLATADALLRRTDALADLSTLEHVFAAEPDAWPIGAKVAVKLARSKGLLRARRAPLDLSVVFAVYGEHERILRPHEHALGEGFLDRKLRQLEWLTDDLSGSRVDLTIVDDGCPDGSGERAEQILAGRHPSARARVLFLERAIAAGHPVTRSMTSASESRKGGAIHLGLWEATRIRRRGHVVLFTDADLSTHLGQAGLLVDALAAPGVDAATGSRRAPTSVVVKSDARRTRGRLFIYLWKKLLPEIHYVQDTQCGFKAFRAGVVRPLLHRPVVRDFAFDLELLLRTELARPRSIAPVPIAWIDSEAASTTVALAPYLSMLRSVVRLYRDCGRGGQRAEAFADAIDSMSERGWQRAVEVLAPRLEAVDTALDLSRDWIDPSELAGRMA